MRARLELQPLLIRPSRHAARAWRHGHRWNLSRVSSARKAHARAKVGCTACMARLSALRVSRGLVMWPDPADRLSFRPSGSKRARSRSLSPYFRRTTRSRTVHLRASSDDDADEPASGASTSESDEADSASSFGGLSKADAATDGVTSTSSADRRTPSRPPTCDFDVFIDSSAGGSSRPSRILATEPDSLRVRSSAQEAR